MPCETKIKYLSLSSAEAQLQRVVRGHLASTGALRRAKERKTQTKGDKARYRPPKAYSSTKDDVLRYSVYRCRHCGFFHIGRMGDNQLRAWREGRLVGSTAVGPPGSMEEAERFVVGEVVGERRRGPGLDGGGGGEGGVDHGACPPVGGEP
jgi:ribosomal protein L44E